MPSITHHEFNRLRVVSHFGDRQERGQIARTHAKLEGHVTRAGAESACISPAVFSSQN